MKSWMMEGLYVRKIALASLIESPVLYVLDRRSSGSFSFSGKIVEFHSCVNEG